MFSSFLPLYSVGYHYYGVQNMDYYRRRMNSLNGLDWTDYSIENAWFFSNGSSRVYRHTYSVHLVISTDYQVHS